MDSLSRREDDALMKELKAAAFKKCDPLVKDFAECSSGRVFSVVWACRGKLNAMQQCVAQELQDDAVDAARQERLKENRLKRLQQQQQQSDSSHRSV